MGEIFKGRGINYHCYADDTGMYMTAKPGKTGLALYLQLRLRLKMNVNHIKTELMCSHPNSAGTKLGLFILG